MNQQQLSLRKVRVQVSDEAALAALEATPVVPTHESDASAHNAVDDTSAGPGTEPVAADTGSASEQDVALVLGQSAASVQGLASSPLTYVSGALGGSLLGGGAGAGASPLALGAVQRAVPNDARVASVDDTLVSVGSVDINSLPQPEAEQGTGVAQAEPQAPFVFEGVPDDGAPDAFSTGEVASQNVLNNLFNQNATRTPLSIDGVMDNEGPMAVLYGQGAALSDATPVITGVAQANTRLVLRNADGEVLGLTDSDASGRWSFELKGLGVGQHTIQVQAISLEREEAQIQFELADYSGPAAQTASNASHQVSGSEDQIYVFTRDDVNAFSRETNINLVSHITVNSLPADGALQLQDGGVWRAVVAGERISAGDIRNGNLRFVPGANESGSAAYNTPGQGNMQDLYAELDLTVSGISPGVNEAPLTLQVSIAPVIDNTQTVVGSVDRVGAVPGLAAGDWARYTFTLSGSLGDTDGSERSRIEVTPTSTQTQFAILQGGSYTAVSPDANGKIWLQAGQQLMVREYAIGNVTGSDIDFKLVGEEINANGVVLLSKDLSGGSNLQALAAPLTWLSTGTEDTPYVFGSADISGMATNAGLAQFSQVTINSLPADGVLQFLNASNQWVAVTTGQNITRQDIAGGRLRFVPDTNESGSAAYGDAGVGNRRDLYAELDLTLEGNRPGSDDTSRVGLTLEMAINPVVDNVLSVTHSARYIGRIAAIDNGANTWQRWDFTFRGTATDTDGSEVNALAVKPWFWAAWGPRHQQQVFAVLENGVYSVLQPDANGVVWVREGQSLFVSEYTTNSHPLPFASINYQAYRQEVSATGQMLAQKAGTAVDAYCCPPSPLVLDLDGNGVQTSALDNGVYFDLNDDGHAGQVAWTDGTDGFLVLDRNGDGQITSGAEMFGDHTVMSNGQVARDGFAALADLDSNADGLFDAKDELFAQVQVWVDTNRDGVSDAQELFGLTELGIQSIRLNAEFTPDRFQHGNFLGLTSSFTRDDGSTAEVVDVWLTATSDENNRYLSQLVI